jgi:hypothetical protein
MTWEILSARFSSECGIVSLIVGNDGNIKITSISPLEFTLSKKEEETLIKRFAAHVAFDKNIRQKEPDNQPFLQFKNPEA